MQENVLDNFPSVRKVVKISQIKANFWNPNKQDQEVFERTKALILKNGLVDPIHVRTSKDNSEIYEIIDGYHRYLACQELGYTEMQIDDLGIVDDLIAQALTISLNRARGKDDPIAVAKIVKALSKEQQSLLPYSAKQIEQIEKILGFNFDQFEQKEIKERTKEDKELFAPVMVTAWKLQNQLDAIKDYVRPDEAWALCMHLYDTVSQVTKLYSEKAIKVQLL